MKVFLTTLNSKFIHSCLSIRYLKAYVKDIIDVEIGEYTINQNIEYIASEIFKKSPDVVGFSTYIWNLSEILRIAEILKIVKPDIKIFLGGPEVTYDGEDVLKENEFIDFIIYGEGEETFKEVIQLMIKGSFDFTGVKGVVHRKANLIISNPPRPLIKDLNQIPSPYEEIGDELENKIIYFESSRGCPFGCKFCLSSTIDGVRYFNIDRVKKELGKLIDAKVRQVKFVDRTFNANKKYAMEIMSFIMERDPKDINFHFEVTAHLLDEEMLEFLSRVKEGLFQFEVGVQSTNEKVIEAVGRTTDFEKLRTKTKRIKSYKKIHQHLDLIAGLPYEGYDSFRKSFNDVYEIRPEKIQLGFLKLLKGSELRENEEKYGFKYLNYPPYEILENNYISYKEICDLKIIDELVDRYYNGEYFEHSLEFIIRNHFDSPFDFYDSFGKYWEKMNYHSESSSKNRLYSILKEYYLDMNFSYVEEINELIKLDFIENNKNANIPKGIVRLENDLYKTHVHEILKDKRLLNGQLYQYKDMPTKNLIRQTRIESFSFDVVDLINKEYRPVVKKEEKYILFIYTEGVINRSEKVDITEIVKELI